MSYITGFTGNVDFASSGNVQLGSDANLHITGGNAGQFLSTDGNGNLLWANAGSGNASLGNLTAQGNVIYAGNVGNVTGFVNFDAGTEMILGTNTVKPVQIVTDELGANYIWQFGGDGVTTLPGTLTTGNILVGPGGNNNGVIQANTGINPFLITSSDGNASIVIDNTGISLDSTPFLNLGNVPNVKLHGGTNGYFLQTDGNGNLSWSAAGGGGGNGVPGGANTQLQYNNAGNFGGISTVTYDGSNLSLGSVASVKLTGGNSGQFLSTDGNGNLSFANVTANTGNLAFTGNALYSNTGVIVENADLSTPATASLLLPNNANTANAAAIINTVGNVQLTSNSYSVTLDTTGNLTVPGNINGANVITANTVSVANTVTAGAFTTSGSGGNIYGANVISANTFVASISATVANLVANNIQVGGTLEVDTLGGNGIRIDDVNNDGYSVKLLANCPTGNTIFTFPTTNGTLGYVLATDGAGNTTWIAQSGGGNATPAGSNTQVQFNTLGSFAASSSFTFNSVLQLLTIANANVTANLNVVGTTTLGDVGNVVITGGTSGQVLTTNGSNVLSWANVTTSSNVNVVTTATYTVGATDQVLPVITAATTTITLPAASTSVGRSIIVKDYLGTDRTGNAITITAAGTDTIDGNATFTITDPWNAVTLIGITASQWMIL